MRAIWAGAIGFGLVNIPVKLYSATQGSELDLDLLDKKDQSRIRFQRINESSGKVVDWENIVKGYKYNNKYVILTDKDIQAASAEKSKVIEITQFVDEGEIDPMLYEVPYYLEPEKSGVRAYALLREALRKSNRVGVSTFVLRNKESIALLSARKDVIVLYRIRFAEEIRSPNELNLPAAKSVKAGELKMAMTLIDQLTGEFDSSIYHDTHTEKVMKIIKAKSRGVKIKEPKMQIAYSKSKDLMGQLKASLDKKKKKAS